MFQVGLLQNQKRVILKLRKKSVDSSVLERQGGPFFYYNDKTIMENFAFFAHHLPHESVSTALTGHSWIVALAGAVCFGAAFAIAWKVASLRNRSETKKSILPESVHSEKELTEKES